MRVGSEGLGLGSAEQMPSASLPRLSTQGRKNNAPHARQSEAVGQWGRIGFLDLVSFGFPRRVDHAKLRSQFSSHHHGLCLGLPVLLPFLYLLLVTLFLVPIARCELLSFVGWGEGCFFGVYIVEALAQVDG